MEFQEKNLMNYVRNRPTFYADPLGLLPDWLRRLLAGTVAHALINVQYEAEHSGIGKRFYNQSVRTIANQGWGLNVPAANNKPGSILRKALRPDIAHVGRKTPCRTAIYEIKSAGLCASLPQTYAIAKAQAETYKTLLNVLAMAYGSPHRAKLGKAWPPKHQYVDFCPGLDLEMVYWNGGDGVIVHKFRRKDCDGTDGVGAPVPRPWMRRVLEDVARALEETTEPVGEQDPVPDGVGPRYQHPSWFLTVGGHTGDTVIEYTGHGLHLAGAIVLTVITGGGYAGVEGAAATTTVSTSTFIRVAVPVARAVKVP